MVIFVLFLLRETHKQHRDLLKITELKLLFSFCVTLHLFIAFFIIDSVKFICIHSSYEIQMEKLNGKDYRESR